MKLDRVDAVVRSIWNSYTTFTYYQEHKEMVERHTLEDFSHSVVSHEEGSVRSNLQELHSLVVPDQGGGILGNKGVVTMLANSLAVSKTNC